MDPPGPVGLGLIMEQPESAAAHIAARIGNIIFIISRVGSLVARSIGGALSWAPLDHSE